MQRLGRGVVAMAAVGLVATVASAAGAPVHAADNGLIGKWQIVDAVPGPWVAAKARGNLTEQARRLVETEVTFQAGAVLSKSQGLSCKRARYQTGTYPTDALFRGSLPDGSQDRIARELGLGGVDVPSVDVDCAGGHFTYHFRDRNTALFALDDVIYTLKRR